MALPVALTRQSWFSNRWKALVVQIVRFSRNGPYDFEFVADNTNSSAINLGSKVVIKIEGMTDVWKSE